MASLLALAKFRLSQAHKLDQQQETLQVAPVMLLPLATPHRKHIYTEDLYRITGSYCNRELLSEWVGGTPAEMAWSCRLPPR